MSQRLDMLRNLTNVRAVFLVLILSMVISSNAKACVASVKFEDTPQYELYESIKAASNTEDEAIGKFSKVSDLGREVRNFREFEINKLTRGDLKERARKWDAGESILAQSLLLTFAFSRADYIKDEGFVAHFESFLRKNRSSCWLDEESFFFKFAEYKLRVAQVYPKDLELGELVFLMREILWYSGEEAFLKDYFDLLRIAGIKLAKEELKSWSGKSHSDEFCNSMAHCIERIRIAFANAKSKNSKSIQSKLKEFECNGKYVNSNGASIQIDLC